MKKLLLLVLAMTLMSCSTVEERSWECYCNKYHVNKKNPTKEQENYFLDCYFGSAEDPANN